MSYFENLFSELKGQVDAYINEGMSERDAVIRAARERVRAAALEEKAILDDLRGQGVVLESVDCGVDAAKTAIAEGTPNEGAEEAITPLHSDFLADGAEVSSLGNTPEPVSEPTEPVPEVAYDYRAAIEAATTLADIEKVWEAAVWRGNKAEVGRAFFEASADFDWRKAVADAASFEDIQAVFERVFPMKAKKPQEMTKEEIYDFLAGDPITAISGSEFEKSEEPITKMVADWFLKNHGGKATHPVIGDVILDKRGVKDSIGHGLGRDKAAAFALVPGIITGGKIIDYKDNWEGRDVRGYVIGAPVTIGEDHYIGIVVVKKSKQIQRFYLHEVYLTKKLQKPFKTGAFPSSEGRDAGGSGVISKLRQNIFKVKQENDVKEEI